MKCLLILAMFALTVSCQMKSSDAKEELLKFEKDFEQAVVTNDAEAIGKFLADDWVISTRTEALSTSRVFLA